MKWLFSNNLKTAEVSPIFKKIDDLDKENYRPVGVLPHMSKAFERIMYSQIESFMEDKLSKLLIGFRNHSTQHCLNNMLEKWRNTLDKGRFVYAMFMNLSKLYDTVNRDLLIANLGAYLFKKDALSFMKSYLMKRQQRVRVNGAVCNFQYMKSPVKLNGLLSKFFCYITCFVNHLIRRDTRRLTNEVFTSNPIVSWKQ